MAFNQWLASIAFDAHKCEKHEPVIKRICPMRQRQGNEGQRDLSLVSTMEIFDQVKRDALYARTLNSTAAFDNELWAHLEARVKYMLEHAGLR